MTDQRHSATPRSQSDTGTAPTSWTCAQCGNLKFLGLTHHCPTAPMLPINEPNDDLWPTPTV